jgi:adenosylcobyric acid synthase
MAALSVMGTSSWAGKSLIATGLCRWFAREGVRVAPFKAQNMSNNARVGADGEMGAAQYLQALACGIEPDSRMNPVLVKPEAHDRSQVVVRGRVDAELSRTPWRDRADQLRGAAADSLRQLLGEYELVVLEGAGSPAEINLADVDLANAWAAELAGAGALLVADIGRGGAFAHLLGTWSLMPERDRWRIGGFVLNRFRGDPELLGPAPAELERLTGVPTLGVVPELDHGLPDEDGPGRARRLGERPRVAVVVYPTASNLDEYKRLQEVADVVWAATAEDVRGAALVVLPGSKEPLGDLEWLCAGGLAEAIRTWAAGGGRVVGVCGGLQLLGRELAGQAALGLLPLTTTLGSEKIVRRRQVRLRELPEPWRALSGTTLDGYEIREGRSTAAGNAGEAAPDGLVYVAGPVLGTYLHGLFEDPAALEALLGAAPATGLDDTFDALADALGEHLDMRRVRAIAGIGPEPIPAPQPPAAPPPPAEAPRSLVLVNTGDGKGKSTAAFGVLLRGVARGWTPCVVQFVKSDRWKVGEETTARRLGVRWLKGGDGFSWESPDLATSEALARHAWELAREALASGEHRLVVLDEITYPINWGWIDGVEVAEAIQARPHNVNVVATGRDAPPALLAVADTVTEMVKVRHAYDRGIKARRGLDF